MEPILDTVRTILDTVVTAGGDTLVSDTTKSLDPKTGSGIVNIILQFLPVLVSFIIVPGLAKIKDKVQMDKPLLWAFLSITASVGLSWLAGQIPGLGSEGLAPDLNQALTLMFTTVLHANKKQGEMK